MDANELTMTETGVEALGETLQCSDGDSCQGVGEFDRLPNDNQGPCKRGVTGGCEVLRRVVSKS